MESPSLEHKLLHNSAWSSVARRSDQITLLERQPSPPFSLSSSDSFGSSSAKRNSIPWIEERKRKREISSNGQQCHIVRTLCVCMRPHCFRTPAFDAERVVIPPSLRRGRKQGLEELEYPPRPGLMEIEGRIECFSS